MQHTVGWSMSSWVSLMSALSTFGKIQMLAFACQRTRRPKITVTWHEHICSDSQVRTHITNTCWKTQLNLPHSSGRLHRGNNSNKTRYSCSEDSAYAEYRSNPTYLRKPSGQWINVQVWQHECFLVQSQNGFFMRQQSWTHRAQRYRTTASFLDDNGRLHRFSNCI